MASCTCLDPAVWGHRQPTCELGYGPPVIPHVSDSGSMLSLRWQSEGRADSPHREEEAA